MKRSAAAPRPRDRRPNIVRRLPRRALLRGALGIGVALPWLELMRTKTSRAVAAAAPRRFGIFFNACGTIPENWRPTGTETSFTLSRILQPLAAVQSDLVVIRGVNMETAQVANANFHDMGMTHMLTAMPILVGPSGNGRAAHVLDGSASGPSVDQVIAQAIFRAGETTLPSLELGVSTSRTFLEPLVTRMSYGAVDPQTGLALPLPPVDDPVQVFTRLFGSSDTTSDAAEIARLLANRQSVLDHVMADYEALKLRVGAADASRLDQHLTDVRAIESQVQQMLANPDLGFCPAKSEITLIEPDFMQCFRDQDLRTDEELALATNSQNFCVNNYRDVGTLQMDLMALAFTCDLTRVASLQWSTAESTQILDWLDLAALGVPGTLEHHLLTHNEDPVSAAEAAELAGTDVLDGAGINSVREGLTLIHTWYTEQFAYFVNKLKAAPDVDGTNVLQNSLIFWTNELGVGGLHSNTNIPYVLAGQVGGQLATGRYLDFLGDNEAAFGVGQPHNRLLTSLMNLMGVEADSFGMPGYEGTLPGLV